MKIPKKLKVGGHYYEVILKDRDKDATDKLGATNVYKDMRIILNSKQDLTQLESTFIHEIIEILSSLNKWDFEERQVCQLETGLYQVLKDNDLLK